MQDAAARRVLDAVRALRTATPGRDGLDVAAPTTLGTALDATRAMRAATLAGLADTTGDARREQLRSLGRIERLDERVRRAAATADARRQTALQRGLEALRTSASTSDLARVAAPIALDACQARRVQLARIRDGVWSPWQSADEDPAESGYPPGRRYPTALDDLPFHHRAVGTGRAVRVDPSGGASRLGDRVEFVAPIIVDAMVLGLLQVELAPELVDAGTACSVERFADALGRSFEVLAVRDRLAAQASAAARLRAALSGPAGFDVRAVDELPAAETGDVAIVATPAGAPDRSTLLMALTPRQRETLELMALGLSNAEIAERLVVGVPTVKSHVTAILRAAGALNRTEAIKRFLEADPTAGETS